MKKMLRDVVQTVDRIPVHILVPADFVYKEILATHFVNEDDLDSECIADKVVYFTFTPECELLITYAEGAEFERNGAFEAAQNINTHADSMSFVEKYLNEEEKHDLFFTFNYKLENLKSFAKKLNEIINKA